MLGRTPERFKTEAQMSQPRSVIVPIAPAGDRRRGPIQPARPAAGLFAGWGPKL
jgi:hypothetical protein